MTWAALEMGAPELAREGWARFDRTHVALLGTLRRDGSPRISPIEPFLISGELVFGVMRSPKWEDLERDRDQANHRHNKDDAITGRSVRPIRPPVGEPER